MMVTRSVLSTRWAIVAVAAVGLSACGGGHNDLRAYIDEVKARPGGRIEPLPQVQPAPTFADGLVHRVAVGNHMGQNYGRIVAISDSEIQLVEIISDGLGGYLERPAAIALAD
jgi:Tfp pilus assembly protein PilP